MKRNTTQCSCISQICCPHNLDEKFDVINEEMEYVIDHLLGMFDRNTLIDYVESNAINQDKLTRSESRQKMKSNQSFINLEDSARPKTADNFRPKKTPSPRKLFETPGRTATSNAWVLDSDPDIAFTPKVSTTSKPYQIDSLGDIVTHSGKLDSEVLENWDFNGGLHLMQSLPTANSIPLCLDRIVDTYIHKLLPWQALLCHRAIEDVRDIRFRRINTIYENYVANMNGALDIKISTFMQQREEEARKWMDQESKSWEKLKAKQVEKLDLFVASERERCARRLQCKFVAQQGRDRRLVMEIESAEKATAAASLEDIQVLALADQEQISARSLQVVMGAAQLRLVAQSIVNKLNNTESHETAFEWLSCVADNALTAQVTEDAISRLKSVFRKYAAHCNQNFRTLFTKHGEQVQQATQALEAFSESVKDQALDHLTRETLISRAFTSHLMNIQPSTNPVSKISPVNFSSPGHPTRMQQHSAFQHNRVKLKLDMDEEMLLMQRKCEKSEKNMSAKRHKQIHQFESSRKELAGKMQQQSSKIYESLSKVIKDRDRDMRDFVDAMAAKFRVNVRDSCNRRRHVQTLNVANRSNFFRFEAECLAEVGSLTSRLRISMDEELVKEIGKAKKMQAQQKLCVHDFMSKFDSTIENIYSNLSGNAGGDRSNVLWVKDSEAALAMRDRDRKIILQQMRRQSQTTWSHLLARAQEELVTTLEYVASLRTARITDEQAVDESEWGKAYLECDAKCSKIMKQLYRHADESAAKVASTIDNSVSSQMDFFCQTWSRNILTMNTKLVAEVKDFLDYYDECRNGMKELFRSKELESYLFEQQSCSRMIEFWKRMTSETDGFGGELNLTLHRLINAVGDIHSGIDTETQGQSHKPTNVSSKIVSTSNDFKFDDLDMRDTRRGELTEMLLVKSDMTKDIFPDRDEHAIAPIVLSSDFAEGDWRESDAMDFGLPLIEKIQRTVEGLKASRLKMLLMAIANDLQVLAQEDFDRYPPDFDSEQHAVLNANIHQLLLVSKAKHNRKQEQYWLTISALTVYLANEFIKFGHSSKVVHRFQFCILDKQSPQYDVLVERFESMSHDLVCVFATSLTLQVLSSVSVCQQRCDATFVASVIRKFFKQYIMVSLLVVHTVFSAAVSPMEMRDADASWLHQVHCMLSVESSWMLAVLDIDENYCDVEVPSKDHQDAGPRMCDKALDIDCYRRLLDLLNRQDTDYKKAIHQSDFDSVMTKLVEKGVPEREIVVLLSVLEDSNFKLQLVDLSVSSVKAVVRTWRLVSYLSLKCIAFTAKELFNSSAQTKSILPHSKGGVFAAESRPFLGLRDLLVAHDKYVEDHYVNGQASQAVEVTGTSPFEGVTLLVQRVCCVFGLPFSSLQALSLIAKSSHFHVDPWIVDPIQLQKYFHMSLMEADIVEYLDSSILLGYEAAASNNPASDGRQTDLRSYFPQNICDTLTSFLPNSQQDKLPVEILRNYCNKPPNATVSNTHLSLLFWLCYSGDNLSKCRRILTPFATKMIQKSISYPSTSKASKAVDYDNPESIMRRLLRNLPQALNKEEDSSMAISSKTSKKSTATRTEYSVAELLGVGAFQNGITHDSILDTISSPASKFLALNAVDCFGVSSAELPSAEQLQVLSGVVNATVVDGDLPSNVTFWHMNYELLCANNDADKTPTLSSVSWRWKLGGCDMGDEQEPDPLAGRKREIELRFMSCQQSESQQFAMSKVSSPHEQAKHMAEYWKILSSGRLSRIHKLSSVLRCLMFDQWTSSLYSARRDRHGENCEHHRRMHGKFKALLCSYNKDSVHQRQILQTLFNHVSSSIEEQRQNDIEANEVTMGLQKTILDIFSTTLLSLLRGYRMSKIAYMKLNLALQRKYSKDISEAHKKCVACIKMYADKSVHRFQQDAFSPVTAAWNVRELTCINRHAEDKDSVDGLKGTFLSFVASGWKSVNREVTLLQAHFDTVSGNLTEDFYSSEDKYKISVGTDLDILHNEISQTSSQMLSLLGRTFQKWLKEFAEKKDSFLGEFRENRLTGDEIYQELFSRDCYGLDIAKDSSDGPSVGGNDTSTSGYALTTASKRSKYSIFLSSIQETIRSYSHTLTSEFEVLKSSVYQRHESRSAFLKVLHNDRLQKITVKWEEVHKKMRNLLSTFVLDSKTKRADCSVQLWRISEDFRKHEMSTIDYLWAAFPGAVVASRHTEFKTADDCDTDQISLKNHESRAILQNAHTDFMVDSKYQPNVLRKFTREVAQSRVDTHSKMTVPIFEFFKKYNDDDATLQFMAISERLSSIMDKANILCGRITEEYVVDKKLCYGELCEESEKKHLGVDLQVKSVMECMLNSMDFEVTITTEKSRHERVVREMNKDLDGAIAGFLEDNNIADDVLDVALPANLSRECKLLQNYDQHGFCNACTTSLAITIARQATIAKSKIEAMALHLQLLEEMERSAIASHLTILQDQLRTSMDTITKSCTGDEINESLKDQKYCDTNSLVNEPPRSVVDVEMDVETTAMASAQDIKQDMLKKILVNSGAKREDYDKEGGGNEDEDEDEEGVDEEGEGRGGREEGGTGSPAGDEGIKVEANNGSESVLGNLVEDNDLDAHKPAAVMLEENSSVLFSQIFGGDTQQMVTTEYIPKEMHPPTEQETELNHALLIEDSSSNMPLVKETSLNVSNSSGTLVIPPLPLKALVTADMGVMLPYGWEEHVTEDGQLFYYNTVTSETSWDLVPSRSLPYNWRMCETEEGQVYYYNDETGVSQWEEPVDENSDDDMMMRVLSRQPSVDELHLSPRPRAPSQHTVTSREVTYPADEKDYFIGYEYSVRPNGDVVEVYNAKDGSGEEDKGEVKNQEMSNDDAPIYYDDQNQATDWPGHYYLDDLGNVIEHPYEDEHGVRYEGYYVGGDGQVRQGQYVASGRGGSSAYGNEAIQDGYSADLDKTISTIAMNFDDDADGVIQSLGHDFGGAGANYDADNSKALVDEYGNQHMYYDDENQATDWPSHCYLDDLGNVIEHPYEDEHGVRYEGYYVGGDGQVRQGQYVASGGGDNGVTQVPEIFPPWEVLFSEDGLPYYYNSETHESSWVCPASPQESSWAWTEVQTDAGEVYFLNELTGETSWDRPVSLQTGTNPQNSSPKPLGKAQIQSVKSDDESLSSYGGDDILKYKIDISPSKSNHKAKKSNK